ncbi:MAG: hypothetical protein ACR2JF_05270 [Iamia sp.]
MRCLVVGRISGPWVNLHLPRRAWSPIAAAALLVLEVDPQIQADRLINIVST